jgi:hypothetical protein
MEIVRVITINPVFLQHFKAFSKSSSLWNPGMKGSPFTPTGIPDFPHLSIDFNRSSGGVVLSRSNKDHLFPIRERSRA